MRWRLLLRSSCILVLSHQSHTLPSNSTCACSVLHEELKSCGSSGQLAGLVGSTVGKALRLLADRAEYMAAAGPELRQVRARLHAIVRVHVWCAGCRLDGM